MTPRVEFLWWEGCPSHERALAELRTAMRDAGLDPAAVEVRHVPTEDDAGREAFVGSPTIRIDGRDLQPPPEDEASGLTCRVYWLRDGRVSPTPDPADLRDALMAATKAVTMAELSIGDEVPGFELLDTEGASHSLTPDGRLPTAVIFTCNHCPYALAWHDRILDAARDYESRGARVLLISPNDAERYPRDSYEAMQQRVRDEGGWPAPYLYDETQEVARAYGAKTTPDVFVVDAKGRLRYRGAPDADYGDPEQNAEWLRGALDAVLEGSDPTPEETEPVGCSIKWR